MDALNLEDPTSAYPTGEAPTDLYLSGFANGKFHQSFDDALAWVASKGARVDGALTGEDGETWAYRTEEDGKLRIIAYGHMPDEEIKIVEELVKEFTENPQTLEALPPRARTLISQLIGWEKNNHEPESP